MRAVLDDERVGLKADAVFSAHNAPTSIFKDAGDSANPTRVDVCLLVNASREVRLEAIDLLPRLVHAMVESAAEQIERVIAQGQAALEFVHRLEASQAETDESQGGETPPERSSQ